MSRLRWGIIILLASAMVVTIVVVNLPRILTGFIESALVEQGATAIQLDIVETGFDSLRLDDFSFTLQRANEQYQVASHGIAISYTFGSLLAGKVNTVVIPDLDMRITRDPQQQHANTSAAPTPDMILSVLPFSNLTIKQLRFELLEQGKPAWRGQMKGQLAVAGTDINAHFDVKPDGLPPQRVELTGSLHKHYQLSMLSLQTDAPPVKYMQLSSGPWASRDRALHTELSLNANIETLWPLLRQWGINGLPDRASGTLQLQGSLMLPANGQAAWQGKGRVLLRSPAYRAYARDLRLDAPIAFELNSQQLKWHVESDAKFSAKKIRHAKHKIKSLTAHVTRPVDCALVFKNNSWACDAFSLTTTVPEIKTPAFNLTTSTTMLGVTGLHGEGMNWHVNLNLDVPGLTLSKQKKTLKLDRIAGMIKASSKTINASLDLSAAGGAMSMQVKATHQIKNNGGQLQFRSTLPSLNQQGKKLATISTLWPEKLLLNDGTISMTGELQWAKGVMLPVSKASVILENVAGVYDEFVFSGLAGTLDAKGVDNLRISSRQALTLANLDVGAPITDSRMQIVMQINKQSEPEILVTDLLMHALGGQMTSRQIAIDPGRKENPFILNVRGVDMEEFLKLEQKQGLLGTGIIDGELPLVMTDQGIFMQNGHLGARKPGGKLRYSATDEVRNLAKTNAGVELLVNAMQNFSYNVLDAVANFTPDGLLALKVRIEGSNPELEGGRPVHLNVNIENNVLELLRSLRLADDIGEKIGQQVQKNRPVTR